MPAPNGPLVGFPELDAIFSGPGPSESPEFQSLMGTLNAALDQANQPQEVQQEAVPGTVNPLAGMAAIFSSILADQLGAQGTTQATRGQIQQAEQQQQDAELRNLERQRQASMQARTQKLEALLQIGEAQEEAFRQSGNIAEMEKRMKANLSTDRQLEALRKQTGLDLIAARTTGALQEQEAKAEAPPKPVDLTREDRLINALQDDVGKILTGNTSSTKLGFGADKLTDLGRKRVLDRTLPVVRRAGTPRLQLIALEAAVAVIQDEDGVIDKNSPGWKRVLKEMAAQVNSREELDALILQLGIVLKD